MTVKKQDRMLTPRQVADRFAVDPKTVTRWAKQGKIPSIRTLGGHRRYPESVIDSLTVQSVENENEQE